MILEEGKMKEVSKVGEKEEWGVRTTYIEAN